MNSRIRAAALGGAALAAATLLGAAAPASASASSSPSASSSAVFVQTDSLTGNAVVAYSRAADGTLTLAGTYPTGGLGGQLTGSNSDHTASQGALALDGVHHLLYAVNPGSNTITVFTVAGTTLTVQKTLPSGGTFPVSIALAGQRVFVLNALAGGSIQGFFAGDSNVRTVRGWHRELGLDTTGTPQFTHTPGQIKFTPNGRQLVVTTKAGSNSVLVYGFTSSGAPSKSPTVNLLDGALPFSIDFDHNGHALIALTGINTVASYRIGTDGTLTALSAVATGQAATCWVEVAGDFAYASNTGSGSESGLSVSQQGALSLVGTTTTDAGTVDAAASPDAHYLYVQTGINGIVDAFVVNPDGSLTANGSVTVPDSIGGEGIVVS